MDDRSPAPQPDIIRGFERVCADGVKRAARYAASILAEVAGVAR